MSARAERQVLEEAADWFARLGDHHTDADETRRWQRWLDASPAHRRAWDAVMAISARFEPLDGPPALDALSKAGQARRRTLRAMLLLAGVSSLGAAAWQQPLAQRHLADLHTGVGETRHYTLDDGSQLWLNTASAVNLNLDARRRLVDLVDGEALISTHPDPRPFLLDVGYASLRALDTRFSVRRDGAQSCLDVYAGRVEVQARHAAARIIEAGSRCHVDANGISTAEALPATQDAWTRGELIADAMPLARFAAELTRYRRGYVTCTQDVASLPLAGVFQLADTDQILNALEVTLPVRARRVVPGWVRLEAA